MVARRILSGVLGRHRSGLSWIWSFRHGDSPAGPTPKTPVQFIAIARSGSRKVAETGSSGRSFDGPPAPLGGQSHALRRSLSEGEEMPRSGRRARSGHAVPERQRTCRRCRFPHHSDTWPPLEPWVLGVEDDGDGTFRLADDNLICMRVPTRCARGARHRGGRRPGQTTRSVSTCPLSTRRQRPRPVVEVRVPANSVKSRRVVTTAERTHEATTRAERAR